MTTDTIPCPFSVGDSIFDAGRKAIANVTAITPAGFEYTYDRAIPFIARDGSSFVGGTCFPSGYHLWRAATASDKTNVLIDRLNLSLDLHFNDDGQPDGYTFYSQARPAVPEVVCLGGFDDAGEEAIYEQLLNWANTWEMELTRGEVS